MLSANCVKKCGVFPILFILEKNFVSLIPFSSAYTLVRHFLYNLFEVKNLLIKDAIVLRLQNICQERNIRYNELATMSGVTPSTVYSLMDERRRDLSVITLKKLCDGLDITVTEFFDDDIFKTLEQEIK